MVIVQSRDAITFFFFLGAFESLMAQSYTSFILGVRCIVVGIYCCNNGAFKIFDSHGRDLYGNSHPEGTCVLLEVPSVSSLVQYIQSLYQISDIFEVKGIQIAKVNLNIAENNSFCPRKQCCPLALSSLGRLARIWPRFNVIMV